MIHICQECLAKLDGKGLIAELYYFISDFYFRLEQPLILHEPSFRIVLHYLEMNRFIITTEAFEDMLYVIPQINLNESENENSCSGYCHKVLDSY